MSSDLTESFIRVSRDTLKNYQTAAEVRKIQTIENLLADPIEFSKNLYRSVKSGLFGSKMVSSSFPIDSEVCFLGGSGKYEAPFWFRDSHLLGPKGARGVPSLITVRDANESTDQQYVVKKSKKEDLFMRLIQPKRQALPSINGCNYEGAEDMILMGSDEFTNEMIIGYLVNYYIDLFKNEFRLGTFRPVVNTIDGFVCGDDNNILLEYADYGSLDLFVRQPPPNIELELIETKTYLQSHRLVDIRILKPYYAVEIIKQVTSAIRLLGDLLHFNSGDLKMANVFVLSTPLEETYDNLRLDAPFSCLISDYGKSSVTVVQNTSPRDGESGIYRLFNYYGKSYDLLLRTGLTNEPEAKKTADGTPYYRIRGGTTLTLGYIRHFGYPFYRSFDLYTFIVSLMMTPEFYYAIMIDRTLRTELWEILWFYDEQDAVDREIFELMRSGAEPSYRNIIPFVTNRKLKCNLVDDYFQNLVSKQTTLEKIVGRTYKK